MHCSNLPKSATMAPVCSRLPNSSLLSPMLTVRPPWLTDQNLLPNLQKLAYPRFGRIHEKHKGETLALAWRTVASENIPARSHLWFMMNMLQYMWCTFQNHLFFADTQWQDLCEMKQVNVCFQVWANRWKKRQQRGGHSVASWLSRHSCTFPPSPCTGTRTTVPRGIEV